MNQPADLGGLRTNDWEQLQDLADRFEQAWKGADTVDLAKFLPSSDSALRSAALVELIKTELEIRCRRRHEVRLERYLERFPELNEASGVLPQLLYEEYRVRQLYGDRPALDTYRARFPEHFAELERLLQARAVAAPAPTPAAPVKQASDSQPSLSQRYLAFGGGYDLIKRIGSGGFGEVWLAEAPGGFKAAVKILFRPVDHAEAQRELQALELIRELRHPFLLQTQHFTATEDRLYIVMELADGSLRDRLKECRKQGLAGIPVKELMLYFREASEALDFLHAKHVQHRDIKPENILLLQRHAKLADFGLARSQQSQRMVTASGSGTPLYMAPEIWRGRTSPHSDQYSLAVTYVELRLDRRLYASRDFTQIMFDHLEQTPDLVPLPAAEQAVLLRALAKDPEQRYPSCTAFVQALEEALAHELGRTDPELDVGAKPKSKSGPRRIRRSSTELQTIPPGGLPGQEAADLGQHSGDDTEPLEEETSSQAALRVRRLMLRRMLGMLAGAFVLCLAIALVVTKWPSERSPRLPEITSWLPAGAGWEVDGDAGEAIHGVKYHDRIARVHNGERVVFVCIRKRQDTEDPPTFYMMENKVWVGLFRAFASAQPQDVKDQAWKAEADRHGDERCPVLAVSVEDAYRCARWLGGHLPTEAQWDKGAGRFEDADPNRGPFREPWDPNDPKQIAIGKRPPLPVGTATHDVSRFGVRDLAGNGREWTRDVDENRRVPVANPSANTRVMLRGCSFLDEQPFRFKLLKPSPDSAYYLPSVKEPEAPDIGFRVVVEIGP